MSETVDISPVDVLRAVERANASEDNLRKLWLREIDGLARLLNKNQGEATGLTYGALGGMLYALRQLQQSYGCRSLEELEERYAADQLRSYPTTMEEVHRTAEHFLHPGMDLRIDTIRLPNDIVHYRLYLGKEFTTQNKRYYPAGTMLASIEREYPPLSQVHERL
jgi:hypothetical protein